MHDYGLHVVELAKLFHDLLQPLVVPHEQVHRAVFSAAHRGAKHSLETFSTCILVCWNEPRS